MLHEQLTKQKTRTLTPLRNAARAYFALAVWTRRSDKIMARFLLISKFCAETGYTDAAVRGKMREGIWLEGRVWRKAPDGHVLIDMEGYEEWVINGNGLACAPSRKQQSSSNSPTKLFAAGSASSPPPLTGNVQKAARRREA